MSSRRTYVFSLALLVGAALLAKPGLAQQYKTDPVQMENRLQLATTAKQVAKNPGTYASKQAEVQQYFTGYFFPLMTQADPDALGRLGKRRDEFFRQFMWKTQDASL